MLLVEDDPEQRSLFQLVLQPLGYTLEMAADAESALSLLSQRQVHLVLTDWNLPGMDGDHLITLIRQHYPNMRTILMSSHDSVSEVAGRVGAHGWFWKRSGIRQLRATVATVMESANVAL